MNGNRKCLKYSTIDVFLEILEIFGNRLRKFSSVILPISRKIPKNKFNNNKLIKL
jgi:hypothetical protein